MADLRKFVENTVDEIVRNKYPHLRLPAVMEAKVVGKDEMEGWFSYRIRILTVDGIEDETMPEIPGVVSSQEYDVGNRVLVVNTYGVLRFHILGRCL